MCVQTNTKMMGKYGKFGHICERRKIHEGKLANINRKEGHANLWYHYEWSRGGM